MKHALLILTYGAPEKIYTQVATIQSPHFIFYIHIDKKTVIDEQDPFYKKLIAFDNVVVIKDRVNVQWGSFRIVSAMMAVMKEALKNKDVAYMHMLSGECLPVKEDTYIVDFFNKNQGKEYLTNWVMPEKRTMGWGHNRFDKYHFHDYFNPRSKQTKDVIVKNLNSVLRKSQRILKKIGIYRRYSTKMPLVYGGSAWWSLSRACVAYIFEYIDQHPKVYNRFQLTQLPDEMFFHTIIMNSSFKEQVVNDNLRYIYFDEKAASYAVILTINNLKDILPENILFARKFANQSKELVDYLKKNIYKHTDQVQA